MELSINKQMLRPFPCILFLPIFLSVPLLKHTQGLSDGIFSG